MRYNSIRTMDISNGPGIRVSIFVQGCPIHCKGCFNKIAWDFNKGKLFTNDTINHILDLANDPHIKGLSILGGEPLAKENLDGVKSLIIAFRDKYPDKDIWLWTGYNYEQLNTKQLKVISLVDSFIDGPFVEELKDPNLLYRGSSNQKVHKIIH